MITVWNFILELVVSVLLLGGSIFAFIGSLGVYRLPDFHTRLHAPAKATTLGVGCVLIASMLYFNTQADSTSLQVHELLITIFLIISAPVSAYMLAKAAVQQGVKIYKDKRD